MNQSDSSSSFLKNCSSISTLNDIILNEPSIVMFNRFKRRFFNVLMACIKTIVMIIVYLTVCCFLEKIKNIDVFLNFSHSDIVLRAGENCYNEVIAQGRSYYRQNISISDCIFLRSSQFSGYGGIIFLDGSYTMSISYSMFYLCTCSERGGGIYTSTINTSLQMNCAYGCSASWFHFADLGSSQENHVNYLSISLCSPLKSGYYPFALFGGDQIICNTNSSFNNAAQVSGFGTWSSIIFKSSFCTITENKISVHICIYFQSMIGEMQYANIIKNQSPTVYVEFNAPRMSYCIFDMNQDTLLRVSYGGTLDVSHCFISHTGTVSDGLPITISNNNTFIKKPTYLLKMFGSYYCYADVPLSRVSTTPNYSPRSTMGLSPINTMDKTPMNTMDKTPMNTMNRSNDVTATNVHTPVITPPETISNTNAPALTDNPKPIIDEWQKIESEFSFNVWWRRSKWRKLQKR